MKIQLSALLSLFLINTIAQEKELQVTYKYIDHTLSNPYKMEIKAQGDQVFSYIIRMLKTGPRKSNLYKLNADSTKLYKNHNENYLVFEEQLGREKLFIKEDLNLFKWEKIREKDSIMGYPCKAAFTEFRGREYKAYYTTKLPFTAAPWKFHGLPGVVLKIYSTDDWVAWEASEIAINNVEKAIVDPFEKRETIDYRTFCKRYKANRKETIAKRKKRAAQQGRAAPNFNKAPRVEVIIPENKLLLNEI